MKKNRWFLRAVVLVVLSGMLNATVTVAGAVAGGSDYPLAELKVAGVDLTKPEAVLSALDVFQASLDELEALLKEI